MEDATLNRVCELATAFRKSAHLLLDHQHKLSLDTWTLFEIQEAFSLILEIEQLTNFHVLPPNHRQHPAIPQLQFVYDLLQKITGLRLWAKQGFSLPQNETTSLRCFRSLQSLELDHVPVMGLKALQTLRPTLKSIFSVKGLTSLSDLFVRCGADKASEFVWDQLQEAVLSHNPLHSLDNSLRLLPNLKVLDVSHCELEDASGLEYLLSVCVLDISYNKLRLVPKLADTACISLSCLIMKNNLLSHIQGLENLVNLEELDLRDNILTLQEVLNPLGALPYLQLLRIGGNPLTVNKNYRQTVLRYLNATSTANQVSIDGIPVSPEEQSMITSSFSSIPSPLTPVSPQLEIFAEVCSPLNVQRTAPVEEFARSPPIDFYGREDYSRDDSSLPYQSQSFGNDASFSCSIKSTGGGNGRKKLRKKRTRQIDIDELETDTDTHHEQREDYNSTVEFSGHVSLLDGDTTDIAAPPTLEPNIDSLPMLDSDLSSSNAETAAISAVINYEDEIRNAAPESSDRLLEQILKESEESLDPSLCIIVNDNNGNAIEQTCNTVNQLEEKNISENNESDFFTSALSDSQENNDNADQKSNSFEGLSHGISDELSSYITPPQSDSEDEKEDIHLFLAKKETTKVLKRTSDSEEMGEAQENEIVHQDIIIAITPLYFKEKNGVTAKTIYKWDVCCLESMELLSMDPYNVLISFNTIKNSYKKRTYIFDSSDFQQFSGVLSPILEKNTLAEMIHSAMTCLKCNTQFSRDLAKQSDSCDTLKCPNCGGGAVVRIENMDHPSVSGAPLERNRTSTPLNLGALQLPNQPLSDISTTQPGGESSESVSVCSETSSSVRRDSDVEVISNPSVSSIEILNEQQIIHDVIVEEDGDEQKLPPPAAVNSDARTPANSPSIFQKPETSSITMQESSSSGGSMAGSVCTTYEKSSGGSQPTSPLKHTAIPQLDNEDVKAATQHAQNDMKIDITLSPSKALTSDLNKIEEGDTASPKILSHWVETLLHSLTGYGWTWWEEAGNVEGINMISNPIRYSYEDFREIDHRLKLYCDVLLFQEPNEQLLGLIKAVILIKGGLREFHGLLVISSVKMYVLEIVGPEDDSPQTWLELQMSQNLSDVHLIYSLYQRQALGIRLDDTILLLSLADSHRANCFFNFLIETLEEYKVNPSIEECSLTQEQSLIDIVSSTVDEADPSIFAIVTHLLDGGCSESCFMTITSTDILLFYANLEWYMPPTPESSLKLKSSQKIANVIAIEVHSDSYLEFQFLDEDSGVESKWEFHVTTNVAACHIIQAIKTPWSNIFSVELEVNYNKSGE